MFNTRLDSMESRCLVEGSTVTYPRIYLCRMRYFWTDMSKYGYLQRSVLKYTDSSDMEALTVPWRIFFFFEVPNWFCYTGADK